jgi:hypothetical protein
MMMAAAAWSQTALAPPRVGFIQDGHGKVRPVNGVAGNFLVGGAASAKILSAAFSGSFGLLKSDSALLVTDALGRAIAGMDAPSGSALFAFSTNGSPALAYFQHTNTFRVWDGNAFQTAGPPAAMLATLTVLTVAAFSPGQAAVIVERPDGMCVLNVQLATGSVVSQMSLPGVTAPALLVASGDLVYRDARGVVLRRPNGSEDHVAAQLPRSIAFSQMGQGWIEITDLLTGSLFAVNIQPGSERYFILPEAR